MPVVDHTRYSLSEFIIYSDFSIQCSVIMLFLQLSMQQRPVDNPLRVVQFTIMRRLSVGSNAAAVPLSMQLSRRHLRRLHGRAIVSNSSALASELSNQPETSFTYGSIKPVWQLWRR